MAYDCIVIGVGGMGSAALYHLAKRGLKVVGIEQFDIAHDRGSSHGQTRLLRKSYFEHPDYVPLLADLIIDGRTDEAVGFLSVSRPALVRAELPG